MHIHALLLCVGIDVSSGYFSVFSHTRLSTGRLQVLSPALVDEELEVGVELVSTVILDCFKSPSFERIYLQNCL